MRSLFTRTAQHKEGHRLTPVVFAFLAAIVFIVSNSVMSIAAFRDPSKSITTGSLPPLAALSQDNKTHRYTKLGDEGLELAARLTEDGGFINRPITWQIFEGNAEPGKFGKKIYDGEQAILEKSLKPGRYHIKVKYGFAIASNDITILPQTRVGLTFVLNVGGVRTLSRVVGVDASHFSDAKHAIISLPANKPEKLITKNISQAQIVRLPAGKYRIESRFNNGNTIASATVTVKPGILTSLNIDHYAALAKISLQAKSNSPINWNVSSLNGNWTKSGNSKFPAMVLAPGRYTFSAKIGNSKYSRTISVQQGKATTVVLGN